MQNNSLRYILPSSLAFNENAMVLINSLEDFFRIDANVNSKGFVVNLSNINDEIKEDFFRDSLEKFGRLSLICFKDDLALLEEHIKQIDFVFIKDLENLEDLEEQKELLLIFEKRALMKSLN